MSPWVIRYCGARRSNHVLLEHDGAKIVGTEEQGDLSDFGPLRHPRTLHMIDVVEDEAGDGECPQVVITSRGLDLALEIGAGVLEGPGNEGCEAAALVLQVAHPEQVGDPSRNRLADPEHHRRSGSKAELVGFSVNPQPLVCRGLGPRPDLTAGVILENFCSAARDGVETGGDETLEDLANRHLFELRQIPDLGHRKSVEVDLGKGLFEIGKQRLVVRNPELRMDPPLEENAGAATGDGLRDLGRDLIEGQNVGFGVLDGSVERTETAAVDAHVRVVDVAIDDVGGDVIGILATAHRVRRLAELEQPAMIKKDLDLVLVETTAF